MNLSLNKLFVFFLTCFCSASASAQVVDTLQIEKIESVTIKAYLSEQSFLKTPASVATLNKTQLEIQNQSSLVSSMNTLAGVRMEERTPGSYRLSIRGSVLRSPFGVRNIKVYVDDLPFTDASGNSYLNVLDMSTLQNVEVLKGPDGSLFGANSGGVLLLNSFSQPNNNSISTGIEAGSYGAFKQQVGISQTFKNHTLQVNQAFQKFEGYRNHSAVERQFFRISDQISYGKENSLKISALYADMQYQTPGGLNLAQMQANPKASRPATATLPSAEEQNIGIRNKMLFGGVTNRLQLGENLGNVTSVFGSTVDFENPFITNYEIRDEKNIGFRSYFELRNTDASASPWRLHLGVEMQQTDADIRNYDNLQGHPGNAQALDRVITQNQFLFARYSLSVTERLQIEAAMSLNFYKFKFKNLFPASQGSFDSKEFEPQWMPRLALSYQLEEGLFWRGSVSRGYSTPTLAEVRSTNNVVNTDLESETGWNIETGFRYSGKWASADASLFRYQLSNSIVNRRLPDETDYFLNAGGTQQVGVELNASSWIIYPQMCGSVRGLELQSSLTLSNFKFRDYQVNQSNFSGNALTGVPRTVVVSNARVLLPWKAYLFVQHNYTSKLPLNDGNTVYAPAYHLLQAKVGWELKVGKASLINFYLGADNLLDQEYSLGNDLNAIGNRYYNPAPLRNFVLGLQFQL